MHQPNTFSARVRPGSPQFGSIAGSSGPGLDLAVGERAPTESGMPSGHPFGHADLPGRAGDAGDRVRELDRRVGQEPAPVAGMVAALARLDPQVDREAAARAEVDGRAGRPPSRGPSEPISTSAANSSRCSAHTSRRPGEPTSSPISISHLALKPSLPRVRSTAACAAMLIVCWPLLSAVPRPVIAAVGLGQLPRRRARLPTRLEPADHVAVAVAEHGRQRRGPRCARRRGTARAPSACVSTRQVKPSASSAGCISSST